MGGSGALVFAGRLVERTELEAKILGILVLARFEATFPRGLLGTVRSWLANDLLASWAAVDAAAPWIITPLIRRHPDLGDRVMRWTAARSLWVRRSAPVAFIPLARHGERLDEAYAIAASLLDDRDDLMHQATGWMLREAGKTDVRRLERFLRAHGPRIPRTTLRYAIERFPPARRRRLLRETR